jgi:hypothetical protein
MTDDSDFSFEGRRYSAVVVSHAALRSTDDLASLVEGLELTRPLSRSSTGDLTSFRAEWHHRRNLYPSGSLLRRSARPNSSGAYMHRCYIAQLPAWDPKSSVSFLFASPHIRVVAAWASLLSEAVDNPRPRYAAPRLDPLFHDLGRNSAAYKATQITLQIPSNVDVEKVSLTGKSPLISALRASLVPVTRPYAVRLEMPREGRPLRFHMDRHGNFWWYQANDQAFDVAARAVAALGRDRYLETTHDLPHRRVAPDEASGSA